MARTVAALPADIRITDYISLGVIAKTFPRQELERILALTKKSSQRVRNLPAHVVMYYVIAIALFMQSSYGEVLRWLLEGIRWLLGENVELEVTSKGGISQARRALVGRL